MVIVGSISLVNKSAIVGLPIADLLKLNLYVSSLYGYGYYGVDLQFCSYPLS